MLNQPLLKTEAHKSMKIQKVKSILTLPRMVFVKHISHEYQIAVLILATFAIPDQLSTPSKLM
jgi:hypothetical protein